MERNRVNSSTISSIGYDQSSNILEIEFKTGNIYQYINIPYQTYLGLLQASSHGKYSDKYIKNGGYSFLKIK